ncbi:MAG: hypothetical protein H8K07_01425 [Nitrospira sp.]|nr:hypothetical protein [Nitrospira sp.]
MITQGIETHHKRQVLPVANLKKSSMVKQPRKMTMERSLLDCIAHRGLIKQADLDAAIEESLSREIDLETLLLDKYRVPKSALGSALSEFYQCPYVSYDERTVIDHELLKNLSLDYLRRNAWIPLKRQGTVLDIVINDPHNLEKGLDIRRAFPGTTIRFSVGLRRDIEQYLLVGQVNGGSITEILGELVDEASIERNGEAESGEIDENDSAIVRLANQVIAEAYRLGASDVHIEPYSDLSFFNQFGRNREKLKNGETWRNY